jgi:hypothetical protein
MTVQTVTAGPFASPTALTRDGGVTTVIVTIANSSDLYVEIPSGCNTDDVFEIYEADIANTVGQCVIKLPSGEDFGGNGSGGFVSQTTGSPKHAARIRKLTSTRWGVL